MSRRKQSQADTPEKPERPKEGGSYRRERPGAPLELVEQTRIPDGAFRPEAPAEVGSDVSEPEIQEGSLTEGATDQDAGDAGSEQED